MDPLQQQDPPAEPMKLHAEEGVEDTSIRPFRIAVPDSEVTRFNQKLNSTRIPDSEIVQDAGNDYGAPDAWLRRLYKFYCDEFDGSGWEARMNERMGLCETRIEGMRVVFGWIKAVTKEEGTEKEGGDAKGAEMRKRKPGLLMLHGWPGSFMEFAGVVDGLTGRGSDDSREPGDGGEVDVQTSSSSTRPTFDVVIPSLPGFCWSDAPKNRGWHPARDTARIMDKLMRRLGYAGPLTTTSSNNDSTSDDPPPGYFVQAGDWGQFPARELGAQPQYTSPPDGGNGVLAVHLNWCPAPLPSGDDVTPREKKVEGRVKDWLENHLGYAMIMRSRPQSLGWMLMDNPVGIMTFLGEKYIELSNPESWYKKSWLDHVCLTTSLYYFSRCIMTAALPYYEGPKHEGFAVWNSDERNRIRVPLGFTSFLWDSRPSGRKGVEKTGNLVWYRERDEAGHFACLEFPEGMVEDLREFFGRVSRGEYA